MSSTASEFLLIDCNAFYVSCERVFNPKLRKIPCIVLSSNDGCIVARSSEAKAIGIPMGAPYFQYKALLERYKGVALSSNYALYADMSRRVMDILHAFCPHVEVYSIDEAFVEFDPCDESLAPFLIDTIKQWTGIGVTIGQAPTKTLAKLASDEAKKKGLSFLRLKEPYDEILKTVPVADVWGIGKKISSKLKSAHIMSAHDLKSTPPFMLKNYGTVLLAKTALELGGTPCLQLEQIQSDKKSITYARSFGTLQKEFDDVYAALSFYGQQACLKLRKEQSIAKSLIVFLHTSLHDPKPYINSAHFTLPSPTNDCPVILACAKKLLMQIFKEGLLYKKVGIILIDLTSQAYLDQDLFEQSDPKRQQALVTLDKINEKFGKHTVEYASSKLNQSFHRKAELQSQAFTTSFNNLLEVD